MGEPSKEALDEARAIFSASTGGTIIYNIAAALQRHMDETEHAKAAWERSVVLSAEHEARVTELEAEVKRLGELDTSYPHHLLVTARDDARDSKAALIADVEDWMSDALLELPHDAIELDRILAKHRG